MGFKKKTTNFPSTDMVRKAEVGRKGLWWATATGRVPGGNPAVKMCVGQQITEKKCGFNDFCCCFTAGQLGWKMNVFFYFNFYIPGFFGEMIQFGEHIFFKWVETTQLEKNLRFLLVAWVGWSVLKSVVFLFFRFRFAWSVSLSL